MVQASDDFVFQEVVTSLMVSCDLVVMESHDHYFVMMMESRDLYYVMMMLESCDLCVLNLGI